MDSVILKGQSTAHFPRWKKSIKLISNFLSPEFLFNMILTT